ncbi:dihydrofolate reductase [Aspergillus undulatus]|uniref:dihydrofolate reductase n=1 Tax=Aspergillus undulatus TaxID=1810928 RepID=UPI003CCD8672
MPSPTPQTLTLIVATTPLPGGLGIGLNGTLPWPRIKSDMSFFARVTSRAPRAGVTNALIMGRKTYDSVPARLRPLGKRVSVVVSRDTAGGVAERIRGDLEEKRKREKELAEKKAAEQAQAQAQAGDAATAMATATAAPAEGQTDAFVSSSLGGALSQLDKEAAVGNVGNIFVIGGAEIYGASLRLGSSSSSTPESESATQRKIRIVMTDVEKLDGSGFECDTFFPINAAELASEKWRRVEPDELTAWVGEEVSGEWIEEGDIRVRMVGYERVL